MLKRIALAILIAISTPAFAAGFQATLQKVFDGDTIEVRDESGQRLRIRLSGIDAPERAQPFGQLARESLFRLLTAGPLRVDVDSIDRYRRLVAKVECAGRDVGLEQLESGFAWFYPWADALSQSDRSLYSRQEETARALHRGLWADRDPMPPWQFRRAKRRQAGSGVARRDLHDH